MNNVVQGSMNNERCVSCVETLVCVHSEYNSRSDSYSKKVWLGPIDCVYGQQCLDMCTFTYPSSDYTPWCYGEDYDGNTDVAVVNCSKCH